MSQAAIETHVGVPNPEIPRAKAINLTRQALANGRWVTLVGATHDTKTVVDKVLESHIARVQPLRVKLTMVASTFSDVLSQLHLRLAGNLITPDTDSIQPGSIDEFVALAQTYGSRNADAELSPVITIEGIDKLAPQDIARLLGALHKLKSNQSDSQFPPCQQPAVVLTGICSPQDIISQYATHYPRISRNLSYNIGMQFDVASSNSPARG